MIALDAFEGAWTVVQHCRPIAGLAIADARFLAVTDCAAELYGYDGAARMLERPLFISETRPHGDHVTGQVHSVLRQHGMVNSGLDYAAVIQRPDGEVVLARKRTHHMVGVGGGDVWLTWLESVSEGEPAPPPDLHGYGLTHADYVRMWGQWSMAEALQWEHTYYPLDVPEKLRYIIEDVGTLRNLCSDDVAYSLITGAVKYKQRCRSARCSNVWYTKRSTVNPQCHECGTHVSKRPRYGRRAPPVTDRNATG